MNDAVNVSPRRTTGAFRSTSALVGAVIGSSGDERLPGRNPHLREGVARPASQLDGATGIVFDCEAAVAAKCIAVVEGASADRLALRGFGGDVAGRDAAVVERKVSPSGEAEQPAVARFSWQPQVGMPAERDRHAPPGGRDDRGVDPQLRLSHNCRDFDPVRKWKRRCIDRRSRLVAAPHRHEW